MYLVIIIIINFTEDLLVISGIEVGFEISRIEIWIEMSGIGIENFC